MNDELVQAWCELNDPTNSVLLQNNSRLEMATLLLGENVTAPAVNGASILGNTDYQEKEKVLKDILSTGTPSTLNEAEYAKALEVFQNNPLVGCTSVLDMARVASGYDPNGDAKDAKNVERFNDYLKRVLSAPFFHLTMNDHSEYHRRESDWSHAINEISNLFDGLQGSDKAKVVTSIKNLVNAVASHTDTRQTSNLFTVSAIYAPENVNLIEVYLYSSKIEMIQTTEKFSDCKDTDIDIRKINLKFNIEMWKPYARKVLDRHVKLVDEWLDDNTTKPGSIKSNLCIGPYIK